MKRIDKALKKLIALARKAHKKKFITLFMKRKEKKEDDHCQTYRKISSTDSP